MRKSDKEVLSSIRAKISEKGLASATDAELMSLIVRRGDEMKDVLTLCEFVMRRCGTLNAMLSFGAFELSAENKGLSENEAFALVASLELGRRASAKVPSSVVFSDSADVAAFMSPRLSGMPQEHFCIVLLNPKNALISVEDVSVGTLNASMVHIRDVFRIAIKKNANAIIAVHNHPSGSAKPSGADAAVTRKLIQSADIVGIKVLDHIIVSGDKYYSFREDGAM